MIYPLRNNQIRVLDVFLREITKLRKQNIHDMTIRHKNHTEKYHFDYVNMHISDAIRQNKYGEVQRELFNRLRVHFIYPLTEEYGIKILPKNDLSTKKQTNPST